MKIEPAQLIAIFLAIIGSYAFTFLAWRGISNHVYSKLDKLEKDLKKLHIEVTNRLTALETTIKATRKSDE